MKNVFILIMIFLVSLSVFGLSARDFVIFNNFNDSFELANAFGKGVIIVFSSPTCGYCDLMKDEVFSDDEVSYILTNNFVVSEIYSSSELKGNMDTDTGKFSTDAESFSYDELFAIFGVMGTPHTAFFSKQLEYAGPVSGYIPKDIFAGLLKYISQELYEKNIEFKDYNSSEDDFTGFKTVKKISEEEYSTAKKLLPKLIQEYSFEEFKNQNMIMLDPYKYYVITGSTLEKVEDFMGKLDKVQIYNVYVIE